MKNQIKLQNTRPNIWGAKYEIKSKTGINKANTSMILFCVICSLGIIQPTKKQKTAGATNGVKIIKINKIYFKIQYLMNLYFLQQKYLIS